MTFRRMSRIKQQISDAECIRILEEQKRGVLSMNGEEGYPYAIPLNHWYCKENGRIYFHSGKVGYKMNAIAASDKVCYCVYDEGYRKEGEWALNISSVVIFGRIRLVEDEDLKRKICTDLTKKFTDDEAYLQQEMDQHFHRTACLELIPDHMTGKLVNEA